jgi:carboxymethylenebutenolidase
MRLSRFLLTVALITTPTAVIPAQAGAVIPAQAGIHFHGASSNMDSRLRGNDGKRRTSALARMPVDSTLPADAATALARLNASPRHGQYVMIPTARGDSIRAWIVYPSRSTKAPVVVVVHEIFGMSTWIRAVADQLAADGYIAIAPDFLSGMNVPGAPDSISMQAGIAAVSRLDPAVVQGDIDAAAKYGMSLPSALPKYGIVGFCWGGGVAFANAVHSPDLKAAVVYYGTPPAAAQMSAIKAPVLGLYGGNDARVVSTIPAADSAMKSLGKTYVHHVYEGATHGFLRDQPGGTNGANTTATREAWPATVAWFRKYLGK